MKFKSVIYTLIIIILIGIFSIIMDRILGKLLNLPKQFFPPVSHPANYTKSINNLEYNYIFKTNSVGLRYHALPFSKQKKNSKYILLLGDSFIEGQGLKINNTLSMLLEKKINQNKKYKHYFINGGLSGTCQYQQSKLLFNLGFKFDLDEVILFFYANDIENTPININLNIINYKNIENNRSFISNLLFDLYPYSLTVIKKYRYYYLRKKSTDQDNFITKIEKIALKNKIPKNKINKWKNNIPEKYKKLLVEKKISGHIISYPLLFPNYWKNSLDIPNKISETKWNNMKKIVELIINACIKRNIKVKLIYIPAIFQYNKQFYKSKSYYIQKKLGLIIEKKWLQDTTEFQKRLAKFALKNNLPFLDLTYSFRKCKDNNNFNYYLDGHWTSSGSNFASNIIYEWLKVL